MVCGEQMPVTRFRSTCERTGTFGAGRPQGQSPPLPHAGAGTPCTGKENAFPVLRADGSEVPGRRVSAAGAGSPSPTKMLQGCPAAGMGSQPRARRSIFAKEDGQFNDMMVTLAGRKPSRSPNSPASTSTPASAGAAGPSTVGCGTDSNGDVRWVIRTHRVCVSRVAGQTLGMVVYSEKGKYGSRISKVKPGGVAEAAGLRGEDIFVKLGDEVVIHMEHQQLVERLLAAPLCFTADVCESMQLPRTKGRYSIEMWREADRRPSKQPGTAVQQPHPPPQQQRQQQASSQHLSRAGGPPIAHPGRPMYPPPQHVHGHRRVSHHVAAAAVAATAATATSNPEPESPLMRIRSSPTLWLGQIEDDEDELAIKSDFFDDS